MKLRLILLGGALIGTAGLVSAGPHIGVGLRIGIPVPIVVREAPPPRVVERIYVSPGEGYVWIPGHYIWTENRWVWLAGSWALPPQPGAYWVDSRWSPESRQWTEAHWEVPVQAVAPAQRADGPPPAPSNDAQVAMPSSPAPAIGEPSEIVVSEAPPPPQQEVIVASPGYGYSWIAGYWGWVGGRREWVRGHWERPPHRHAVWIAPRWEHRGHDYVYIRGSWH